MCHLNAVYKEKLPIFLIIQSDCEKFRSQNGTKMKNGTKDYDFAFFLMDFHCGNVGGGINRFPSVVMKILFQKKVLDEK